MQNTSLSIAKRAFKSSIIRCMICFGMFGHSIYCPQLFAQSKPDPIIHCTDCPDYILEIQKPDVQVFKVQTSYQNYYKTHTFQKNTYSQYYKRWMAWAQKNMDEQGSIRTLDPEQLEREQQLRIQLRQTTNIQHRSAPNWKFLGPSRTYDTDGTTKVTWQTNIYSIAVAPSNPNVLYAGGETGGLWKTVNKGLQWTLLTADVLHDAFEAIAIHPKNPDTVYAATSGKLIRSVNGGLNWQTVYSESGWNAHDLEFHRSRPNVIMAVGNKGLLRTEDGGKTWSKIWTEMAWTIQSHTTDPEKFFTVRQKASGCEFLKSSDGGKTWNSNAQNWYSPLSGTTVTGAILAICPSNDQKIYAYLCGQGGSLNGYVGVFVSNDEGVRWDNTHPANAIGGPYTIPQHTNLMAHNGTDGFDQGFYDMAIVVNPNNENELIAGGTSWFKSVNGGATWTALGSYVGGLPWSHPDLQCLAVFGNDLWIGSDGGLNYSNNFAQIMEVRMDGISGADLWGFDGGWNEDILVGGRYHNGNMAWHESFPSNSFYRMGGAEAATGYVNPGPGRKMYFSDIGGYSINGGITNGVEYFPVGLFPNESYAYYANSQMTWHPRCWNIVYLGNENKIWKSEDGGATFQLLHQFPGVADHRVFEIEVSRSNPEIIYCSQWDGTDDSMWITRDGGASWQKLTSLPLPNNNDRVKMSVSGTDPNELWVAVTYGSNGKKIYHSIDAGKSWTNLTTTLLNDVRISDIHHAFGTAGGVYLGTNRGVFYRNQSMADWLPYSTGLPISAETNRLKAFYKTSKLRNGCWGFGVWESELFEKSTVLPQIMADKLESKCLRDTFYFDDHSVVDHQQATWRWNFTNAAYVDGEQTRTPKVIFKQAGKAQAFMELTTPDGVYRDTLQLLIGNDCEKDSLPGYALALDGQSAYALIPSPNITTNTITMMAWVKSTAVQNDWAGILFIRGNGQAAGLSVLGNGELRYHWNTGGYNWSSSARLMQNEWTHVALVVEPGSVTIYKNGIPYKHSVNVNPHAFTSPVAIGADLNGGARFFKGSIDEVCLYNRALSQNEIREYMHLARTHTPNLGLMHYFQFNEADGQALDRQSIAHASLHAPAQRIVSTLPVGPGTSQRIDIRSKGIYNADKTQVNIETADSGIFPNGEICLSRINHIPDQYFSPTNLPTQSCYWILHNYGTNTQFSDFKQITLSRLDPIQGNGTLSDYAFFRRAPNADTAQWNFSANAIQAVPGKEGIVTIANPLIKSESQWLLTKSPSDTLLVSDKKWVQPKNETVFWITPNPAMENDRVWLHSNAEETVRFQLLDQQGKLLRTVRFKQQTECPLTNLPPGQYYGIFQTSRQLQWVRLNVLAH